VPADFGAKLLRFFGPSNTPVYLSVHWRPVGLEPYPASCVRPKLCFDDDSVNGRSKRRRRVRLFRSTIIAVRKNIRNKPTAAGVVSRDRERRSSTRHFPSPPPSPPIYTFYYLFIFRSFDGWHPFPGLLTSFLIIKRFPKAEEKASRSNFECVTARFRFYKPSERSSSNDDVYRAADRLLLFTNRYDKRCYLGVIFGTPR